MSRIRYRKVSDETGEEVPDEHIVKGYEVSKGRYVVVDPDELEPFIPAATRTVDLEEFVDLDEIDPVYFDERLLRRARRQPQAVRAAGPGDGGGRQGRHRPLRDAQQAVHGGDPGDRRPADDVDAGLRRRGRAGRTTIDELGGLDDVDVSAREVKMAEALVESLTDAFDPTKYRDDYREQVLDLIAKKAAGEEFEVPEAATEKPKIVDLMAALEASVEAAKAARKRHPTGRRQRTAEGARSRREPARVAKRTAVVAEVDGRQLELSNLDKVLYPSGFTKGEVIDYHARIAPVMRAAPARAGADVPPLPERHRRAGLLREALPGPPAGVGAGGARAGRPPRRHRVLLHRGAGGAGVGRQHGGDRAARADGAGRRPRHAAGGRVRLRSRAADRHRRLLRDRPAASATILAAVGARGLVQDVGLEGPAAVRAAEHRRRHARAGRRLRPRRRPGARAAAARSR